MRFIRGHAARGRVVGDVERARISATHKGKPKSTEQRRKMSAAQLGPKGNNWRGGAIVREGRALRYVGRDHPMADTYGYVYEHRFVMAEHLGRPLATAEHVHHVDLDKTNNAIENLVVLTRSQHRRLHNLIRDQHVGSLEALMSVQGRASTP